MKWLACVLAVVLALSFTVSPVLAEGDPYAFEMLKYFGDEIYAVMMQYEGDKQLLRTQFSEYGDGAGSWMTVPISRATGENILYIFRKTSAGNWRLYHRTASAFPEKAETLEFHLDYLGNFYIKNYDGRHDYARPAAYVSYTFGDDQILLNRYSYTDLPKGIETKVDILEDNVMQIWEGSNEPVIVRGYFERDIRYINYENLPKTLAEAQKLLSMPPAIPEDSELVAQEIKFDSGKSYPVYSGPGEEYYRAADGKATVSTNDWIQVFGQENGWALIQYDITSDHMRFGFIDAAALPKGAQVSELTLEPVPVHVRTAASLTDDPLNSAVETLALPAERQVRYLAAFGAWAYVEAETGEGQLIRGFVPMDSLDLPEPEAEAAAN